MQLRLQLYGTVQWVLGQRAVEVRGRARQDLLLSLVSSQGQARSVEFLLSEVWAEPPQSGRNAVQRHVSSLRNELAGLGVADPLAVLETVNGGYRIATGVDTDLWRAEDETSTVEDCENAGCQWWREPLVGSSWDRHRPLRARLNTAAARRFCELMKTGTGLSSDDAPSRVTSFLDHNLSTSAVEALAGAIERLADPTHQRQWLSVTQPLIASAQLPASIVDRFQELARTTAGTATKLGVSKLLHQCFDFWAAGRSNEALDLLESTQTQVPGDLSRRMIRWLVWLPPEDPSCRHIAAYLLQEVVAAPAQGERSLVALDSMCLNRIPDGRNLAEYEVEHAHETADHLRSLRVRYLLQLASPVAQVEMDIIDSLATINHPDARVEAQRFRFLSAIRRCDLEIAKEHLSTYSRVVQEEWAGAGDDFAQMARAVLSLSSYPPARR
ncbi:MAG: AfsR/SARP family transcriptional regulator, partial [Acidimicrobiales bacterium]